LRFLEAAEAAQVLAKQVVGAAEHRANFLRVSNERRYFLQGFRRPEGVAFVSLNVPQGKG